MTPYSEWLRIRDQHPMRTLNDCLIFVDTISTIPPIDKASALNALEVYSTDGFCRHLEQWKKHEASDKGTSVRTLESHNAAHWLSAALYSRGQFVHRLMAILGNEAPPERTEVATWLRGVFKTLGYPESLASLKLILAEIGYDEDLDVAARQLWSYLDGVPYRVTNRVVTRPRRGHLLVLALFMKDRLHYRPTFSPFTLAA